MNNIQKSILAINSISVYRKIINDEVIAKLQKLLIGLQNSEAKIEEVINLYNDFFYELSKNNSTLEEYIINKIIFDENSFTNSSNYKNAAMRDLDNFQVISRISSLDIKNNIAERFKEKHFWQVIESIPDWQGQISNKVHEVFLPDYIYSIKNIVIQSEKWMNCIEELDQFHRKYGCGEFAQYRAFIWEKANGVGYLKGISNPDPVAFSDLTGYERERFKAVENIEQFISGCPANNVLLYGDRGTGKSSTVKAILNKYYKDGVRLIEVPKSYLADFPEIVRQLKNRPQKFIIFIDDLVFADDEENYTALKAALEGGIEYKTSNIIIYATSNRKYLVKEYFSERKGLLSSNKDEEINARDSIQEKLSLADRFGIQIVFSSPDQNKYLEIVDGIALKRNIGIDSETLHKEAIKWALWYNGFSARTARQFIDWIEGKLRLDL